MAKADPVLIFYKSETCFHCTNLARIWGDEMKGPNTVKKLVGAAFPNVRFQTVVTKGGVLLNEKEYPSGITKFAKWFPMILLVPGRIWNKAMAHLGPNNPVSLLEGTQVMNGVWKDDELHHVRGFDTTKPEGILAWVKQALEDPEFKRVQNGLEAPPSSLPLFRLPEKPSDSVCTMRVVSRSK